MAWYEVKSIWAALRTYTLYGALMFTLGTYKGCETGYNHGYRNGVQDVQTVLEREETLEDLLRQVSK